MIKPEPKALSFFSIAEITWEWSRAPLAHALPTSDVEKSHWELEITLIDEMVFGLWDDFVSVWLSRGHPSLYALECVQFA